MGDAKDWGGVEVGGIICSVRRVWGVYDKRGQRKLERGRASAWAQEQGGTGTLRV